MRALTHFPGRALSSGAPGKAVVLAILRAFPEGFPCISALLKRGGAQNCLSGPYRHVIIWAFRIAPYGGVTLGTGRR